MNDPARPAPPIRHDIICLSTNHWTGLPTSKQSLMLEMSKGVRVLYVEPPMDTFSVLGRRRRWPKLRGLRRVRENLWVLSPVALSASSDPARRARCVDRLVPRIARAAERAGLGDPILWCFAPEHVGAAGRLGERAVAYSAADEPAAFSRRPDVTRELEERMLEASDLVFVVSEALLAARAGHRNVHRLPNAADVPHFKRALAGDAHVSDDDLLRAVRAAEPPPDLRALGRPVILYGGAAYEWFDFELLREAAALRPGWVFALVGPGGAGESLPCNVVRFGRRPYDEFPRYVAACDVAMMPWRECVFSRNADPIVLYQYLLCGKPVVATPFPAALERGGLVATAADAGAFVAAIERALLEGPDDPAREERTAFGLGNTWGDRAQSAAGLIEEAAASRARTQAACRPERRDREDVAQGTRR